MFPAARIISALAVAALLSATALANDFGPTSGAAADSQTAKPLPFHPDEELIYQADFSKLMLRGIEIAEFRFTVERGRPPAEARTADAAATAQQQQPDNLVFKGDVRAKGWFRKIFGIDFHYNHESTVAPDTLLILHTSKLDEQGKRVRVSDAVFDRATNVVTWTERNPNDPSAQPRVVRNVLDSAAHDIISAIYFLRTQQLRPGQSFELAVSDSGQTVRVPVRVIERKTLKTVVGRVPALRVEIGLFGAGRLVGDREGEMTLWITDDARRIPVRARLSADIGTLDIKLKKVSAKKP
ncbi:MAG TPA: DUF3108 domain-containing protein [Pyrinomonadaceae bacterium]|nr:DUF3108 domain-containing protein [Pyrinomonadaceae bacterium]